MMGSALAMPEAGAMDRNPYGFREQPFRMTPDARMYFPSSVHSRAHAHLVYGLAQMEGFVVITGEVGAGKTTLVEHLCAQLDPERYAVARIATTQVSGEDLLRLFAEDLGAPPEGSKAALLRAVTAALRDDSRRHLLIVDEAQGLPRDALEELRMLSNITAEGKALLQTVLLGQPQLRHTLASPELDQLRQRILASFHLGPLSFDEARAYVHHRMRAVGWGGDRPAWDEEALASVHLHSGGIPRRINRLCARVLLSGGLERAERFTAALVEETARELDEDLGGASVLPRAAAISAQEDLLELSRRIDALERVVADREHVFNRFRELFGGSRGMPR